MLYIGVTNNLERRIKEHKEGTGAAFTKRYNVQDLIFYEIHNQIEQAIKREKQIKEWKREWKLGLIQESNPKMLNLAEDWS
ncbi:MAG: excinuclease subunit [Bacteroidetes bacterium]|nr:excinuclease subunit [Bacteroidota bacterium]